MMTNTRNHSNSDMDVNIYLRIKSFVIFVTDDEFDAGILN